MAKEAPLYRPLDPQNKEIRILIINPELDHNGNLVCSFDIVSLLQDPPPVYEAISWCWGSLSSTREILLDGHTVQIPSNAHEVVRKLCFDQNHHQIWMDAICIDQGSTTEKGHQISLMGDVYSQAVRVLSWLGQSDPSTEKAFHSIDVLISHCREHAPTDEALLDLLYDSTSKAGDARYSSSRPPDIDLQAIATFYSAPWFRRLWIAQEVLLAKEILCFRGDACKPWIDIALAARWLEHHSMHIIHTLKDTKMEVFTVIGRIWRLKISEDWDLGRLLLLSLSLLSTLPHDKVFGILGMAERSPYPFTFSHDVAPDYEKSLACVYAVATTAAIEDSKSLYLLEEAQIHVDHGTGISDPGDSTDHWPSWIPRYNWRYSREHGSPSYLGCFSEHGACGNHRPEISFDHDTLILHLRGVIIDTVHRREAPLAQVNHETSFAHFEQCRDLALANGKDETAFAVTITCGHTPFGSDARADLKFMDNYTSYKSHLTEGWNTSAQLYADALWDGGANRPFLTTQNSNIGMGPPGVAAGDVICILFGAFFPAVLRPRGEYFDFLGSAYLHGVGDGEYIKKIEAEGRFDAETKWFSIR